MNKKNINIKDKLRALVPYLIIVVVVVIIRFFIITPVTVVGISMYPTLEENDVLILDKVTYKFSSPKRFDLVVVNDAKYSHEWIVKRIIGLPGEHVYILNNKLYINNEEVTQAFEMGSKTEDFFLEEIGYEIIPEDMYFVMGDNRNNSLDSRKIGLINKKNILGKTSFRYFPLDKIGSVK